MPAVGGARVGEMAAPGAWVHRVAINAANSYWRRRAAARRAQQRLEGHAFSAHEDPDVASDLALRQAVAALPARQRRALVLRYFADLTAAEVADDMQISQQAVRNLTHRAIETLRERFLFDTIRETDDVH